jgi:hypothetical protein
MDEKDKDGILLIIGDHGPWLARGMNYRQDPDFVVQDRFGVAGAVYPANVCPDYLEPLLKRKFVTPTRLVREVIRCLANGQDPFVSEPDYILYPQWRLDIDSPLRYDDFLYE